jgi:predicted MFS family arabinose efflux permease
MTDTLRRERLRPGTIPVMTAGAGVAVGNIYFFQPLLHAIAVSFDVSDRAAGLVATAAQMGYAVGIALVVPLADTANLRRLTTILVCVTSFALLIGAAAPTVSLLALATFAVATTSVLAQIITPTAAAIAPPGTQGHVMGVLTAALSLGVLLSRTVAGAVAEYSGSWRTAYLLSGLLTLGLLLFLPRAMPEHVRVRGQPALRYKVLIASLPRLFMRHPEARLSAYLGACVFAAFSGFWTNLAFHLAEPQFGMGPAQAGLFGLWSAPGTLLAFYGGRLTDRFGPNAITIAGLSLVSLSLIIIGACGGTSLAALIIGANVLGFGGGCGQVANQSRLFSLGNDMRARLNTIYMTSTFIGGAVGTMTAVIAYSAFGWVGMILTAGGYVLLAAIGTALALRGQR